MTPISRAEARALGLKRYFAGEPCFRGHTAERFVANGICVECHNERDRKARAANPERYRERDRKYYADNVERYSAYNRVRNHKRRARKLAAGGTYTAADIAAIRKRQGDKCSYCAAPLHGGGHLDHSTPLARGGSNGPENLQLTCDPCNLSKGAKDPFLWVLERLEAGLIATPDRPLPICEAVAPRAGAGRPRKPDRPRPVRRTIDQPAGIDRAFEAEAARLGMSAAALGGQLIEAALGRLLWESL
jgi:5-methylcytosine-specific restriction endonuclease McrA